MHKKYFFQLFISSCFCLIVGCDQHKTAKQAIEPDMLVDKAKMVELLTEMIILETMYQKKYSHLSTYGKALLSQSDSLFAVYHIDQKIYEQSMHYYGQNQEEMTGIYQQVKENLLDKQKEKKDQ